MSKRADKLARDRVRAAKRRLSPEYREYQHKYMKEYRKRNKETIAARERRWLEAHKEHVQERKRRLYLSKREELRRNAKEYRKKNAKVIQQKDRARWKARYYANQEKENMRGRTYRANNKDKVWATDLHRYYGITIANFNAMLESQSGLCAICHKKPSGKRKKLNLDHDHETNKVRGLLCMNCNWILGLVKDNPDILRSAAAYLDEHSGALDEAARVA